MEFSTWLLYATVALIAILSPGPAILLAVTNSVTFGMRRVVFSSLGNICGICIVSTLAMTGLGAVLRTSSLLFCIVKLLGAGYLVYIGMRQWRSKTSIFARRRDAVVPTRTNFQLYSQGVLLAITNPKAILFFTALFPQFVSAKHELLPQFAIMTGTFMTISFCVLMCYAALAQTAGSWFGNDRRATIFNRTTGGAFMLLGAGLLRLKIVPA